jgi:uncharacterized protein (DUF2267 family)
MRTTSLEVFASTVQTTNDWLTEIMLELGESRDRRLAWHILTAVLHALRDRLQPDIAADLGTQLPMLVRGAYYEGYKPSDGSNTDRSVDAFMERIEAELPSLGTVDLIEAVRAACNVIARNIEAREAEEIWKALPEPLMSPAIKAGSGRRGTAPELFSPGYADKLWREVIDDGMYGEAHTKTGKDDGVSGGVKKARPH